MDVFSALKEGIINISGGEKSAKKEKIIFLHTDIGDSSYIFLHKKIWLLLETALNPGYHG